MSPERVERIAEAYRSLRQAHTNERGDMDMQRNLYTAEPHAYALILLADELVAEIFQPSRN